MTINAFLFGIVGYGGKVYASDLQSGLLYFCLLFAVIGFIESVDFPSLISTMGNWTQKKTRGTITGIWATCSNAGNIIGVQTAALILYLNGDNWYQLMFYVTVIYIVLAVTIFGFFVPFPKDVGLVIEEHSVEEEHENQELVGDLNASTEHELEEVALLALQEEEKMTHLQVLSMPGVLNCGFSFFCIKFAIYSLFLWIPLFMSSNLGKTNIEIANIQTVYEVGSAIGSVLLGWISDKFDSRKPLSIVSAIICSLISFSITINSTGFS